MDRRNFLKLSGGAALIAGNVAYFSWLPRAGAANVTVNLSITSSNLTMVDGRVLHVLSYQDATLGIQPTIVCQEGDTITIDLNNTLGTNSAFSIANTNIRTDVPANAVATFSFTAPSAGSYLFHDDLNNGVNRVLGLHGTLVVMPVGLKSQSFVGGPSFVRQYKWLLGNYDPVWNDAVQANGDNYVTVLANQVNSFEPKYFTINGASFHDTHNPNTELMGAIGNAALVRMLNAGLVVHSMHFHGNHVEVTSINHVNHANNRKEKDVVSMFPLDTRDVILPFKIPPDIPAGEFALGLDLAITPQSYPMHCHTELSQTAGGGFYPHGMHTGIVIGKDPLIESDLTQDVAPL